MNITFMIGNGFDLNIGLNTQYKDFYPHYIKNNPDDMIAKSINENTDKWSDLELALGEFVENISDDEIDSFFDSKELLEQCLTEYLKEQENSIDWKSCNGIGDEFQSNIIKFYKFFGEQEKISYNALIAKTNRTINYKLITFNYTNILEKLVKETDKFAPFTTHKSGVSTYNDHLYSPLHIHGTLSSGLMIGVDNASQIKNETIKNSKKYLNYLSKIEFNKALGENRIKKAKEIIDQSYYICLFGLSFGETDEHWWKYLISWLNLNESRRLVLFVYDKEINLTTSTQKLRYRDKIRDEFIAKGKCKDNAIIERIIERIIVIPNSDMFTLKTLKVKELAIKQ